MKQSIQNDFTLGLDIGVTSVGWALLDFENEKIVRLGVRKFEEPRVPKTGDTLTAKRREKRTSRRTIRRRSNRQKRLLNRINDEGLISERQLTASLANHQNSENIYYMQNDRNKSPWELRAEGLYRELNPIEWARVLIHLSKHRGYQSNSIEKKTGGSGETGKLLSSISSTSKLLDEYRKENSSSVHTIGEMYFHLFPKKKRNDQDQYTRTIGREEIIDEINILFNCQRKLNNPYTTESFKKDVLNIINSRRNYADGPGGNSPYGGGRESMIERMVGKCTLDPNEKRAPQASYTATYFRILQSLNNLRVGNIIQQNISLSSAQKKDAIDKIFSSSKTTYAQLRKVINLEDKLVFKGIRYNLNYREIQNIIYNSDSDFYNKSIKGVKGIIPQISVILDSGNTMKKEDRIFQLTNSIGLPEKVANKLVKPIDNPESKVFLDLSSIKKLEKVLAKNNIDADSDKIDEIVRILTIFKEETACKELIEIGIPAITAEELALNSFSSFMNLSIKTMKKLIPHLEAGLTYDKACSEEGFDHAQSQIDRDSITNPTVFRAFKQTQKLIKAIVREYGIPKTVCLEVARDLSKNKAEKDHFQKQIGINESRRRIEEEQFISEVGRPPIGREAQVWRFYKEQNGKCLYCGNPLGDLNQIFATAGSPIAEIEHTLPYSRSLDNRQCNKTATCSKCNRQKGNKTPFEYFNSDLANSDWLLFSARCKTIKDKQKREILLTTDWDEQSSGERQLNDTRYISRVVQNWLEKDEKTFHNLLVATPKKDEKRNIFAVKGSATSVLRKVWQLERHKYNDEKIRLTEKNHALDAAVVAAATIEQIQLISNDNRKKQLHDKVENEYRPTIRIQKLLPQPWPTFSKELLAFYGYKEGMDGFDHDPNEIMQQIPEAAKKYDIANNSIAPLFVSWMPQRSVKGAIHKETLYRVKNVAIQEMDKSGKIEKKKKDIYLNRIPLEKLTSQNLEKMAGAYDSLTGKPTPLYNILRERLDQFGGDPKKAFKEPIHKGNKPNAPVIKKVRIQEQMSGGVRVQNAAAENGKMIRVDIFRRIDKNGKQKFLLIPIYTKHRVMDELPLKAIKANSPEEEWDRVLPEEFWCSLYTNDYIEAVKKKDGLIKGYYVSTDRSTAKMILHPADSRSNLPLSIKTGVEDFKKFHIDVLGNKHIISLPEKRVILNKPGQKG